MTTKNKRFINVLRVKETIKWSKEFHTSSTFIQALDEKIKSYISDAIKYAEADGRKTVMDRDLK